MNRARFIILLIAVIISSFVGGIFGQLYNVTPVVAKETTNYFDEIRTKAVYLVGRDNKIRASFYLGLHDSPQLVLYDKEGRNRFNFGLAPAGNPGMTFNDDKFNRLIDIDTKYNNASITVSDSQERILWQTPHGR